MMLHAYFHPRMLVYKKITTHPDFYYASNYNLTVRNIMNIKHKYLAQLLSLNHENIQ